MGQAPGTPSALQRPAAWVGRGVGLGLLAKDWVLQRLWESEARRGRTVQRLLTLHGLPQKIGQILALSRDELAGHSADYTILTGQALTLKPGEAAAYLDQHLDLAWRNSIRELEPTVVDASLGRVFRARLCDGRAIALKVQHPGIRRALEQDLQALGWLAAPLAPRNRRAGFDLDEYRQALRDVLEQELDYEREAESMRTFGRLAAEVPGVMVPEVVAELSGPRTLASTWLEGAGFDQTRSWPVPERQAAGRLLLRLFLHSALRWGLVHGDPHPGNYRFIREGGSVRLGVLDFGCMQALAPSQRAALSRLLLGSSQPGSAAEALAPWLELGFRKALLEPLADRLTRLNAILFRPFAQALPFAAAEWDLGREVEELLGDQRWNFRYAGPPELIFFLRAWQGLLQYLRVLDAPFSWRQALEEVLADHTPTPPEAASRPGSLGPAEEADPGPGAARWLRVRVGGASGQPDRVQLTLPARAVRNLCELMPDGLPERLSRQGLDLEDLVARALRQGLPPMDLFECETERGPIRVWLE